MSDQKNIPGLDFLLSGYDVFGNYLEDDANKNTLFDFGEGQPVEVESVTYLVPPHVKVVNENHDSQQSCCSGVSLREYQSKFSESASLSGKYGYFKGSISETFSSTMSEYNKYAYAETMDSHSAFSVKIDLTAYDLRAFLLPKAKADIDGLDDLAELYRAYGTHVCMGVTNGGQYEAWWTMESSDMQSTTDIGVAAQLSYNKLTKNARFAVEVSEETATRLTEQTMESSVNIRGGTDAGHSRLRDGDFTEWYADVCRNPEPIAFLGDSLAPLWMLAEKDSARAAELKSYYDTVILPQHPGFPDEIAWGEEKSSSMKESGSDFLCPEDSLLTGREHDGDENGKTRYYYRQFTCNGRAITYTDMQTAKVEHESDGTAWVAPEGYMMVGRKHDGDENKCTYYYYAKPVVGTQALSLSGAKWSSEARESGSKFHADEGYVLTGRKHKGDENGQSKCQYARLVSE